ncbi:helix-turn-helix transcriptional regulator [Bacillus sp. S13(2024)]|uniref:helix-turn-helix domain-containing protein n=1 Tax=Bacillus sp. S13(2024) TaxID=3162885 RepID=UPI003D25AA15
MTNVVVGRCLLQKILDDHGLSQLELSLKTGISASQLNDYTKNRKTMTLKTAKRIANALNCYIDDLYEFHLE